MLPTVEQQSEEKKDFSFYVRLVARGFIYLGIILLLLNFIPLFLTIFANILGNKENKRYYNSPVSLSFLQKITQDTYTDPGSEYFSQLVSAIKEPNVKIDTSYKKLMYLSIDNTPIQHIRLASNISGTDPKEYNNALNKGLAHLKGTPLPGDGGISVIYGHSGIPSLLGRRIKPKLIFTYLGDVRLGQKVLVEKDGKKLYYKVVEKKIVKPYNLDLINKLSIETEKIVLVTCWPPGLGSSRLIVIAERI